MQGEQSGGGEPVSKNDEIQAKKLLRQLREEQQKNPVEELRSNVERWQFDPELFFVEALGIKQTNQQRALVRLVLEMMLAKVRVGRKGENLTDRERELSGKLGISVMSGKGLGKDFTVAGLCAWFLLCWSDFVGLVTAPTGKQLEDVLSSEVSRVLKNSPLNLWQWVTVDKGGFFLMNGPKKAGAFITKRTANVKGGAEEQGEALAGLHGDFMCLMADEASGLPDGVFNPLETTMTGICNLAILIGNPTRNTGYFYRTHFNERDREMWEAVRWDAEESDLEEIKPGLKAQIARMEAKYGRDSNAFRINVQGLPPLDEYNTLIPLDWIQSAVGRDIEVDEEHDPLVFGVDVGRGGDPSICLHRKGRVIVDIRENKSADTMVVARWVMQQMEDFEPDATVIDHNAVGAGVYDRLRELGGSYGVYGINFAENPSAKERFRNLRAEMYWKLREEFQNRTISIPEDEELVYELSSIKVEEYEPRLLLKSKKKMKLDGDASPNKADALAHSYYVYALSKASQQKRDPWADDSRGAGGRGWMSA